MKLSSKIMLGMATVAATGVLILITRSYNTSRRLTHISEEGYETAHDILYPTRYNRARKLHYGPVLPASDEYEGQENG
jgi:hypothetical protein